MSFEQNQHCKQIKNIYFKTQSFYLPSYFCIKSLQMGTVWCVVFFLYFFFFSFFLGILFITNITSIITGMFLTKHCDEWVLFQGGVFFCGVKALLSHSRSSCCMPVQETASKCHCQEPQWCRACRTPLHPCGTLSVTSSVIYSTVMCSILVNHATEVWGVFLAV